MKIANDTNDIPKVLFVDDEKSILKSLIRFGRTRNWDVHTANSGEEALEMLETAEYDVIVSDMRMPYMNGDIFLSKVREISPLSTRILLTGYSDAEATISAINKAKVYNYINKPWNDDELDEIVNAAIDRHTSLKQQADHVEDSDKRNKKLSKLALLLDKKVKERTMETDQALALLEGVNMQAEQNFYDSLNVLNQILEWKEEGDSGHTSFTAEYGEKIAKKLYLEDDIIHELKLATMLHRVGLLSLPDEIRAKPVFMLTPEERSIYQQYPIWGEMALSSANSLRRISTIVRHHKEAVNGKGFPDGLTDRNIPIASKIICVVGDFYDAYNGRLERNISGVTEAKDYINKWTGKRYDTQIVNALWDVLGDYGKNDKRAKRIVIKTVDLAEGIKLDADIMGKNKTLLLTKGSILNDVMIQHLKDYEEQFKHALDIRVVVDESDYDDGTEETCPTH